MTHYAFQRRYTSKLITHSLQYLCFRQAKCSQPVHSYIHPCMYFYVSSPFPETVNTALCLKNAPTLASCSFDKHGIILTFFGKQRQHTFKNAVHTHLSLTLHFYLFYIAPFPLQLFKTKLEINMHHLPKVCNTSRPRVM